MAIRKRETFTEICARFPAFRYKNFRVLARARHEGKLPEDISTSVGEYEEEIDALMAESKNCRQESEQLLEETRRSDTRKVLDPSTDSIPLGHYPKLRECKTYPLRHAVRLLSIIEFKIDLVILARLVVLMFTQWQELSLKILNSTI